MYTTYKVCKLYVVGKSYLPLTFGNQTLGQLNLKNQCDAGVEATKNEAHLLLENKKQNTFSSER